MGGGLTNLQVRPGPLLKLQTHNYSSPHNISFSQKTQTPHPQQVHKGTLTLQQTRSYSSRSLVKDTPSIWTASSGGIILEMFLSSPLYPTLPIHHQVLYILPPKYLLNAFFSTISFATILHQAPFTSHALQIGRAHV